MHHQPILDVRTWYVLIVELTPRSKRTYSYSRCILGVYVCIPTAVSYVYKYTRYVRLFYCSLYERKRVTFFVFDQITKPSDGRSIATTRPLTFSPRILTRGSSPITINRSPPALHSQKHKGEKYVAEPT